MCAFAVGEAMKIAHKKGSKRKAAALSMFGASDESTSQSGSDSDGDTRGMNAASILKSMDHAGTLSEMSAYSMPSEYRLQSLVGHQAFWAEDFNTRRRSMEAIRLQVMQRGNKIRGGEQGRDKLTRLMRNSSS